MDRRQKALTFINPHGRGLEIGPSYNPLVTKAGGARIETVDHADRETLVEKYAAWGLSAHKIAAIEPVDHIWAVGSLLEVIPEHNAYDYILASHFIEHTVDMVSFLHDCQALLTDNGRLSLVVPDKRYCFDRFQSLSTVGDVIDAFHAKNAFHTAGTLVDHQAYACQRRGTLAWNAETTDQLTAQFPALEGAADVLQAGLAQDRYHDIHNWKFTPVSFDLMMRDLAFLGFHTFGAVGSFPTEGFEFFVTLGKDVPWPDIDRIATLQRIESELGEPNAAERTTELAGVNATLQRQVAQLREELDALRASTSWRVTAPMRQATDSVRRLRRERS